MKKQEIWCMAHKAVEYGLPEKTIQCGAALNPAISGTTPDNTGDNISELNPFYAENTGIYWLWKHKRGDIKGQYQYRRRLKEDYEEKFDEFEVVTCVPLKLFSTLEEQYAACHNIEDLQLCEFVVKELYPDYSEDWDKVIKRGRKIYYSNGFILPASDFNAYCKFLFSVLKEVWNRKGFTSVEDLKEYVKNNPKKYRYVESRGEYYQCQIGAFLSERLWTLYLLHNFTRICEEPYTTYEGV